MTTRKFRVTKTWFGVILGIEWFLGLFALVLVTNLVFRFLHSIAESESMIITLVATHFLASLVTGFLYGWHVTRYFIAAYRNYKEVPDEGE